MKEEVKKAIFWPVIIVGLIFTIVFICTHECEQKSEFKSIKAPPVKMKKRPAQEPTMYRYPSGDTGSLPYDWRTKKKGEQI